MSEDRLEKALEALRNESATPDDVAAARARVWNKIVTAPAAAPAMGLVCAEIRSELQDYQEGRLAPKRRLLVEDHLGRCPACRREFAELRGERKTVAMPTHRPAWRMQWQAWAVAACLLVGFLYMGRDRLDSLLAPSGPRATVESVTGDLHRVPEGVLVAGASLGDGEVVRTGGGSRAVLRLADGSRVEVNERSELFVHAEWTGATVNLRNGDIIVEAAKQRHGRLRVQTRDSVASVRGTVFAVSAGITGSVVSVIEGSVQVEQPGGERLLTAGQQAASTPALQTVTVGQAVAWSPDSEKYLALLGEFSKLEKQIAQLPQPALRTQSRLLPYLPPNPIVYAAIPNLSGTIQQAIAVANQQAIDSAVFGEWWNSTSGQELRQLVGRAQSITPMLGEEIVFVLAAKEPGAAENVPVLLAEVQPGRQEALKAAIASLPVGNADHAVYVNQSLMVFSDSDAHLQWVLAHLGQGVSSEFASAIAARYQRGAGWLVGINAASAMVAHGPAEQEAVNAVGAGNVKQMFFEQRSTPGGDQNEATFVFRGPRTGISSWLAEGGTSSGAEYLTSNAMFALSASTRQPRQLYDEITSQIARVNPEFQTHLADIQAKLGVNIGDEIASALGTDFAIGIERAAIPVPGFVAAVSVYQPGTLDAAIAKLVEAANKEIPAPELATKRIMISQENAEGRAWTTMRSAALPTALTWTYDRGYMVLTNDRALALNAIATRGGGFQLVWSEAFRQQMPSSTAAHPSGFVWLNLKGALQGVGSLVSNPAFKKLVEERDPVLVIMNGESEQIHVASRTSLTSLILDFMLAGAASEPGGKAEAYSGHDIARR